MIGVIAGDTRSLYYSSYANHRAALALCPELYGEAFGNPNPRNEHHQGFDSYSRVYP